MSPEKQHKHTLIYRSIMLSLQIIATGALTWIGAHTIPFISDYFKMKEKESQERHEIVRIVKNDSTLIAQHLQYDVKRDSIDDIRWNADGIDKDKLNKKVDQMTEVFVETLNTVSSIQNRLGNKNYLRNE